jgi:hypothetical protein
MSVEPGAEVRAPDAHVLALADSWDVAAAYRFVDIAAGELQFGGDFGDGEELIAGVDAGLAHGRRGRAQHVSPQGRPELLEGAEECRDVFGLKVGDPPRIGHHERDVRVPVHCQPAVDWLRFRCRFVSIPGRSQGGFMLSGTYAM